MKSGFELFKILKKLLMKRGYPIKFDPRIKVKNRLISPDIIFSRDNFSYFVELKAGKFLPRFALSQMKFYQENLNTNYGYLAVYDDGYIKGDAEKLFLDNGFGIIKFNEKEITEIKEPYLKKELTKKKKVISFDKLSNEVKKDVELEEETKSREEIKSRLDYIDDELQKFPLQFILYILFGGLFFFSISKIFELWFKENLFSYIILSLILIALIPIIFIIWKFCKKVVSR